MSNYYYDIRKDLEDYPDNWLYIAIGGRNTGKTYSALRYCKEEKKKFVFVKRTMDDVDLLCSGSGRIGKQHNEYGVDLSPFKSLNRDFNWNVRAFSIREGLGGFWNCNDKNEPEGLPIGYLFALSSVQKYKGFDMSECDYIIFDEFIPQKWERVSKSEGNMVLDLYKTVARDREHRGKEPLKLLCLANATNISNPIMNTLEVTDDIVEMQLNEQSIMELSDRGILLHMIKDNEAFKEVESASIIYKAMGNTQWGHMALESDFAYDDFSAVRKTNLKGYRCTTRFKYKNRHYYIYTKDGYYWLGQTKSKTYDKDYNLETENDQKKFFIEKVILLRNKCINGRVAFQNYTLYDLIINYKKFFVL